MREDKFFNFFEVIQVQYLTLEEEAEGEAVMEEIYLKMSLMQVH